MVRRKQASLNRQNTRAPASARHAVAIDSRCAIGGRDPQDVLVTDLGLTGCCMRANVVGVTKSEDIELWLGTTGPLSCRLEWARDGALGVSFKTPLEPELLERMCGESQRSKVVPIRS